MYDNIEKKLKTLAKIWFFALTIIGIVSGIIALAIGMITEGLTLLIAIPISAYVYSLLFYACGELFEKVSHLEQSVGNIEKAQNTGSEKSERANALDDLLARGLITEEEYKRMTSSAQ